MRLLFALFVVFCFNPGRPAAAAVRLAVTGKAVPGELIVRFKAGFDPRAARAGLVAGLENEGFEVFSARAVAGTAGLSRVKLPGQADLAEAAKALRKDPRVELAEPNYFVRALSDETSPNDPLFDRQWNLKNTGQADSSGRKGAAGADIHVAPLWAKGITGDRKVLVAVIDTGVDFTHPDLAANVYTNPGEIPANGIDDDRNGYVDDVHGFNTQAGNGETKDDNGHGTHCAGVIGAVGDNGVGVAGINRSVSILPVKFLSADGSGTTLDAIKAIEYARKMKVKVMSNSWGGGDFSQALKDAIDAAKADGILFVAAAGNEGLDVGKSPVYPAAYASENVIAVAATDNRDQLSEFSNYGKAIHLAAPGVRILSTVLDGGYKAYSGTSMAAPHVAGVAALLASVRPELAADGLKRALIESSDSIALPAGKTLQGGRLNALRAVTETK